MRYVLEQRIHTLSQLMIEGDAGRFAFMIEDVSFSQWPASIANPWEHQYWLSKAEIEAGDYVSAWRNFRRKLIRIVPRLSVVCQCYIEFLGQPILITRADRDIGFIHWVREDEPVGLSFMEQEREATKLLLQNETIPEEFFYYWNDAINSMGYASKLLLMMAAVETLVKVPTERGRPQKDFEKMVLILGADLKEALWGEEGNSSYALRHRLAHGDYFAPGDIDQDYLSLLHRRVMTFLNQEILGEDLLENGIVNPQRHLLGNRTQAHAFLKPLTRAALNLPDVMSEAVDDIDGLSSYETLSFNDHHETF